ncbi:MAG TPA: phosphatidylserine decarboxylase [Thermoplasmata archaeon]|nr:phosphatidylserine decarboxylase [Thermoplasmata archaeon]
MIARGGAAFVFVPLLGIVAAMAGALALQSIPLLYAVMPLGLVFLFALAFFRDPHRVTGEGVVSAADGRVLDVDAASRTLTVFMSVSNVHVNRAPWPGVVTRMTHTPGGHAPAYADEAAKNERLETIVDSPLGPVRIVQIAGAFARRIVPYVREGDRVKKGQRIGMIRFGSRVELTLPPRMRIVVTPGDRVRAGETTVAVIDGPR